MTNICYNCLDRNIESGNADKIAIYWEGNDPGLEDSLTYSQLLDRVCQVLFFFKKKNRKDIDIAYVCWSLSMNFVVLLILYYLVLSVAIKLLERCWC